MKKILIINNERDKEYLGWIPDIKEAISKIGDYDFEVIHHSEISDEKIEEIKPDYLYLTGRVGFDWDLEEILKDYDKELKLIKTTKIPTLGVCAGHQLMAIAHGSSFGKMIEVAEGEEDIRESGFTKIDIVKNDGIFSNLGQGLVMYELHRDEVKSLPDDFDLLASTEMCKIQAMKHKDKILYGVQFHPEKYDDNNTDGKVLLEKFLSI